MIYKQEARDFNDYGINSSDSMNLLMGSLSILMWFYWIAIIFTENLTELSETISFLFYRHPVLQYIGIGLTIIGVILAIWGRISRGIHASSWGLSKSTELIKKGPFRVIRHPSYTFYICMFIALPLISGFIPSLLLLTGIWSYYIIAKNEEELLIRHFGDKYEEYIEQTWRFIPLPKIKD